MRDKIHSESNQGFFQAFLLCFFCGGALISRAASAADIKRSCSFELILMASSADSHGSLAKAVQFSLYLADFWASQKTSVELPALHIYFLGGSETVCVGVILLQWSCVHFNMHERGLWSDISVKSRTLKRETRCDKFFDIIIYSLPDCSRCTGGL